MLFLLACADDPAAKDTAEPTAVSCPAPASGWPDAAPEVVCNVGGEASALEAALTDAGLERDDLVFPVRMWNAMGAYTEDDWLTSWFRDVHGEPEFASCFADQVSDDLDTAMQGPSPAAATLRAFAAQVDVELVADPADAGETTLEEALGALVALTGGDDPAAAGELPEEVQAALVPVVLAITDGITARRAMDDAVDAEAFTTTKKMFTATPGFVIDVGNYVPNLGDPDEKAWWESFYLTSTSGPRSLVDPAARIADAVERLTCLAGTDVAWRFSTDAGDLVLTGTGPDTHDGTEPTLLVVDFGGDDTWVDGAGATLDQDNPVSVAVDLGGNDAYGYVEVPDENDIDGVLISDADGRQSSSGYWISNSETGRQGSGRYGIGMLFDVGGGNDSYASLRMSQGVGIAGVGLLYDDAGDDTYASEAGAQGAGIWGYGLLLDGGGNDTYRAWSYAQGFGYVGSGGLAYDGGGDDVWYGDPGRDYGGTTIYASAQLADGQGNNSFVQGAGFGMRADSWGFWLSGGFGVLRDAAGDDQYTAGVFSQATGYAKGTGLLSDGAGDDTYDALWYIQGGAAHFALAILTDGGGNDHYNPNVTPLNVMLGSGHDGSVGVFVDEGGDDVYHATTLALGASNCQGIGVFVDNAGSDTYQADSTYAIGLGNHSGECDDSTGRTQWDSTGIFIDSGGDPDTYVWTDGDSRTPSDDSSFGIAWSDGSDEHGGAVDGSGESNFHAD